jgi:hypothetical protein
LTVPTLIHQAQDLDLANRQEILELGLHRPTLGEPLGKAVVVHDELLTAVVNRPHALLESARGHGLQDDAASPQACRVEQLSFILAGRENDHGRWPGGIQAPQDAETGLVGKCEIQKEHVRIVRRDRAQAFGCRAAHRDDLEVGV